MMGFGVWSVGFGFGLRKGEGKGRHGRVVKGGGEGFSGRD